MSLTNKLYSSFEGGDEMMYYISRITSEDNKLYYQRLFCYKSEPRIKLQKLDEPKILIENWEDYSNSRQTIRVAVFNEHRTKLITMLDEINILNSDYFEIINQLEPHIKRVDTWEFKNEEPKRRKLKA